MTAFEKVRLVDDHPLVRAGCRQVLRAMRATVLEATTGMAALRINRDEQPDLILLDISLPDMNGADALGRLRAENPRARVIMLTMYEDIALAHRLLKRGAAAYVTKNDSPALLLQAIDGVLHGCAFVSPKSRTPARRTPATSTVASPRCRRATGGSSTCSAKESRSRKSRTGSGGATRRWRTSPT